MSAMLEIRHVTKQFATTTAVNDVSLAVEAGEIFALLGPNGAGKTTLIRMMLGLIQPDSGEIVHRGMDPRDGRLDAARIGYLPEDRGLYPDVQVLRTLAYFGALRGMERRAAEHAASEWLERMQLSDRAREPLKSLSKGNQQKIQFISAVLHRPQFAVLDEPFSGLDPLNQDLFLTLIRELRAEGMTIVLSAHQMQLVERLADRLMVMNRGSAVLTGTFAEVRRRWTTGSRLVVQHEGAAPDTLLGRRADGVEVRREDDSTLSIFIAEGEALDPILIELGTQLRVRGIESHAVTLHDVYVDVIGRHNNDTSI